MKSPERLPISISCPKCTGVLHKNQQSLKCDSCGYLETVQENINRNVTYFINGKTYTQEEARKLDL